MRSPSKNPKSPAKKPAKKNKKSKFDSPASKKKESPGQKKSSPTSKSTISRRKLKSKSKSKSKSRSSILWLTFRVSQLFEEEVQELVERQTDSYNRSCRRTKDPNSCTQQRRHTGIEKGRKLRTGFSADSGKIARHRRHKHAGARSQPCKVHYPVR